MEQLTFFQETVEEKYEREMSLMREKYDNLRKSQHARITGLQKDVKELKTELEFLKGQICKGNFFL